MKAISIAITGKVQGVYYRASTVDKAKELGINGTVQNLPDGSVFIIAEGDETTLDIFTNWCKKGPILARVKAIKVTELNLKGYTDFVITP